MVGYLVVIIIVIVTILLLLWIHGSSSEYMDESRLNLPSESFTQYATTNHDDVTSPINAGGFTGMVGGSIDPHGSHDELVPARRMTVDKDEYKRKVGQNESMTNPVRVYQKFGPRFKNPPMKTYGNIRMLGYRPGKKELHDYWCSREKVYAQS